MSQRAQPEVASWNEKPVTRDSHSTKPAVDVAVSEDTDPESPQQPLHGPNGERFKTPGPSPGPPFPGQLVPPNTDNQLDHGQTVFQDRPITASRTLPWIQPQRPSSGRCGLKALTADIQALSDKDTTQPASTGFLRTLTPQSSKCDTVTHNPSY